jgi:hypothetical protein
MSKTHSTYHCIWRTILAGFICMLCIEGSAKSIDTISTSQLSKIVKDIKFDSTKTTYVPRKFSSNKKVQKKERSVNPQVELPSASGIESFISVISYLLAGTLLLFFLYLFFKEYRNRKIEAEVTEFSIDQIDDIEKANLGSMLAKALQQGDYRLALRIQFLMLLQRMQMQNLILWKPNKTNRLYINEIKDTNIKHQFSYISRIFENTWYGGVSVNQEIYDEICTIIQQIKLVNNDK